MPEDQYSCSMAYNDCNKESSSSGETPTMNRWISEDSSKIEGQLPLKDKKEGSGEITSSSILDQTALSESSFPQKDPSSETPDAQTQSQRNSYYEMIRISLLIAMVVGLVAIGFIVAPGRDHTGTQNFQDAMVPASLRPSVEPAQSPTPKHSPPQPPTAEPAVPPAKMPTKKPMTAAPTNSASVPPTDPTPATYVPGNLTRKEVGLLLSEGLRARIIATSGQLVEYHNGLISDELFHGRPDFGATFADTRPFNEGGWVYASNSEMPLHGEGGVGSITFDKNGKIIDYRMVMVNTTMNCGGGKTPWETWISCEEVEFFGEIYQVDPFGELKAEKATIGSQLGRWESFAYDVRDPQDPKFFASEDHNKGTVRRFRPNKWLVDWDNPWDMLHVNGTIDYLIVIPNNNMTGGTFKWVSDLEQAKNNARKFYPQSEGIEVYDGQMHVACKGIKQLFTFDLDEMKYFNKSVATGLFDGGPDQMQRLILNDGHSLLYFTEEGGVNAGVHARDDKGRLYTVLESPIYTDETTGLAFSPDGKHMYVAYQGNGTLFHIWREDGLSFGGKTLNVKYHQTASTGGS